MIPTTRKSERPKRTARKGTIRKINPTDEYVTVTREELRAMGLDEIKKLAEGLGYFIENAANIAQARALLLASAVEFKNLI